MDMEVLWTSIREDILSPTSSHSNQPYFNQTVLVLILWYLHCIKGYTIKSIQDFTTYHFVNLVCADPNNNHFTGFEGYWSLTKMEHDLLHFYLVHVRSNNCPTQLTCLLPVNSALHLTQSFFETCDNLFDIISNKLAGNVSLHLICI